MMEKLRIEEMEIPSEIGRFKMYGEMALYPRVDSKTFVRVARAHDLCRYVSPSAFDMRSCMPNQIQDQLITRWRGLRTGFYFQVFSRTRAMPKFPKPQP